MNIDNNGEVNVHANVHIVTWCGTIGREHVNVVNVCRRIPRPKSGAFMNKIIQELVATQSGASEVAGDMHKCNSYNRLRHVLVIPNMSLFLLISKSLGGGK